MPPLKTIFHQRNRFAWVGHATDDGAAVRDPRAKSKRSVRGAQDAKTGRGIATAHYQVHMKKDGVDDYTWSLFSNSGGVWSPAFEVKYHRES